MNLKGILMLLFAAGGIAGLAYVLTRSDVAAKNKKVYWTDYTWTVVSKATFDGYTATERLSIARYEDTELAVGTHGTWSSSKVTLTVYYTPSNAIFKLSGQQMSYGANLIDPGIYDWECTATGYISQSGTGVDINISKTITVDLRPAVQSVEFTLNYTPDTAVFMLGNQRLYNGMTLVPLGNYNWECGAPGYITKTGAVNLSGPPYTLNVDLPLEPALVELTIDYTPDTAVFKLEGTQLSNGTHAIEPGFFNWECSAPGYETLSGTDIDMTKSLDIRPRLPRITKYRKGDIFKMPDWNTQNTIMGVGANRDGVTYYWETAQSYPSVAVNSIGGDDSEVVDAVADMIGHVNVTGIFGVHIYVTDPTTIHGQVAVEPSTNIPRDQADEIFAFYWTSTLGTHVKIEAIPYPGQKFSHWVQRSGSPIILENPVQTILIDSDYEMEAFFTNV